MVRSGSETGNPASRKSGFGKSRGEKVRVQHPHPLTGARAASRTVRGRSGGKIRESSKHAFVLRGLNTVILFPQMESKRCPKCDITKPIDAFYNNRRGLSGYCKECTHLTQKQWYAANKSKKVEMNRRWRTNHSKRWKAINNAGRALWRAIKAGDVIRSTECSNAIGFGTLRSQKRQIWRNSLFCSLSLAISRTLIIRAWCYSGGNWSHVRHG
jgi:hypothetical protein